MENETADYYRQKAEQCRRMAGMIMHQNDPVVANLMALAVEFEAKAVALTAEQTTEAQLKTPDPHGPDRS